MRARSMKVQECALSATYKCTSSILNGVAQPRSGDLSDGRRLVHIQRGRPREELTSAQTCARACVYMIGQAEVAPMQ